MTRRVSLEPAYVLHSRPYSNTSLIVDLFTPTHGRIPALARSARGMKSRYKGKLQLFTPLLVSWSGKRELMSLGQAEFNGSPFQLDGQALLCGFYLNELLVHLIHRDDPYPMIYELYEKTLMSLLDQNSDIEIILRSFEKRFLERLGYALPLKRDAHSGENIREDYFYQYIPDRGFLRCESSREDGMTFSGKILLAIADEQWHNSDVLQDAKRLMRLTFTDLLGNKIIKSRELFT